MPLETGWLAGRYGPDTRFAGVRARWSRAHVAERAALGAELAALLPAGMPLVQGASAFLPGLDGVSSLIRGTRSLDHLETSLRAAAGALPADVQAAIRAWHRARLAARPLAW